MKWFPGFGFQGHKREFQEEIDAHLQMAIADRVARGETAEAARQAAAREYGNTPLVQDVTRDMWGQGWFEQLRRDVRYALRQLRKSPGFSITATAMLAMAICANSTVFSWIDRTMLRPIPGAQGHGRSCRRPSGGNGTSLRLRPFSYLDYRRCCRPSRTTPSPECSHISSDWITLTDGWAQPQRIYIGNVSANFFDVLEVKPQLGRFFLPQEETRAGARRRRAVRRAWVLVMEDALCGRPWKLWARRSSCPAYCDGDRRSAGGIYRGGAGASG